MPISFRPCSTRKTGSFGRCCRRRGSTCPGSGMKSTRRSGGCPRQEGGGEPTLSRELSAVFDRADAEAKALGDAYISTEHLVLGLAEVKGTSAKRLLQENGVSRRPAAGRRWARFAAPIASPTRRLRRSTSRWQRFTINLTDLGTEREGRSRHRARRRSPAHHAGVVAAEEEQSGADRGARSGKDGDRGGLGAAYHRWRCADVPGQQGNRLARTSASYWPAPSTGASSRNGSRRSSRSWWRAKATTSCSSMSCTPSSEPGPRKGAVDASNMLKPPLARGELHVVGATTLDGIPAARREGPSARAPVPAGVRGGAHGRRHRGHPPGPQGESTRSITGIRVTDNALVAAATLSNRYIGDRFLPDKAIDLVDEASSRLRIEIDSLPQEIDEVERSIIQLEIQRQALLKEKDKESKARRKETRSAHRRVEGTVGRHESPVAGGEGCHHRAAVVAGRTRWSTGRRRTGDPRGQSAAGGRIELRPGAGTGEAYQRRGATAPDGPGTGQVPEGRSDRRRHRRDRRPVDRDSRLEDVGIGSGAV